MSIRQMHHTLTSCTQDTCLNNLYGCCCISCMSAETKAMLDGRQCTCCDCLCGCWTSDFLYQRRQLRQKYSLQLDITPGCSGCCSCSGTYAQDVCTPLGMYFGLSAIAAFVGAVFKVGNLDGVAPLALIPYVCATNREARHQKEKNGGRQSYSGSGAAVPAQGPHRVGLCDCMEKCSNCGYVCFCAPCALGYGGSLVQGRECDCCDCFLPPTPWQLRKSVQSKYGMPTDKACSDCCKVTFCGPCMVCQDLNELEARNSKMHYMPVVNGVPVIMNAPPRMEMGQYNKNETSPLMAQTNSHNDAGINTNNHHAQYSVK